MTICAGSPLHIEHHPERQSNDDADECRAVLRLKLAHIEGSGLRPPSHIIEEGIKRDIRS